MGPTQAEAKTQKVGVTAADYDNAHAGLHASPLMRELWAQAMGDQYPAEVEPFSACSWWLLGNAVAALRLRPDGRLVDLGCGRGGPGLWLTRALSARLVGIDFSPVAVDLAAIRAARFVAPGRAEFRLGTFDGTGLPDGYADGVLSMDALQFAKDRVAALREVRRILAPAGRAVVTVRQRPAGADDWPTMAASAGLDVEQSLVYPDYDEYWRRLYALWTEHEQRLRPELGDAATDNLMREVALAGTVDNPPTVLMVVLRHSG
ncbi:class I SAM-dependent methyltransferase [Rugosimonospora africana]|nr:class I SAM-dependent methyltransferase [Rugosimonospora africana]